MKRSPLRDKHCGAWSAGQVRGFVKDLRREIAGGWEWLTPRLREALVDSRTLSIIASQDRVVVTVAEMHRLRRAMLVEAGLLTMVEADLDTLDEADCGQCGEPHRDPGSVCHRCIESRESERRDVNA